ncbi:MAG: M28 family peptidase [Acidobacteria bacterium]|nr:M28 family peptidase [Acidobacteriota bacterium]
MTIAAVFVCAVLAGCTHGNTTAAASPPKQEPVAAQPAIPDPGSIEPLAKLSGDEAMQYARQIVAFGPRWPGNPAHRKVEQYILDHLKGVEVEQDRFTAQTNAGPFPMNNIIAKFPGEKDGIVVLASHYETNWPLRNTSFIGANDGAATSALLLEIAAKLRSRGLPGYAVWLVWDDGEESFHEPVSNWVVEDALYGTRHLAQKWQQDGTAKRIKALMVLDMIGDKDLDIQRDSNSTPWLEDLVYKASSKFGYQSHFFATETQVEDDHMPFAKIGVPVADVIDLNYGYNGAYHHTTEDTLDKISGRSLQIAGDTVMEAIAMLNRCEMCNVKSGK